MSKETEMQLKEIEFLCIVSLGLNLIFFAVDIINLIKEIL